MGEFNGYNIVGHHYARGGKTNRREQRPARSLKDSAQEGLGAIKR